MAATVILSRPKPTQIDTLTVDAAISETHTKANKTTDHPVEQGFNVTDHIRPEPDGLSMECVVSNTPLSGAQQVAASSQLIDPFASSTPVQTPTLADQAYQALRDLMDKGTLVKVVTSLRTYEDMAITNLSIPRNAKNFNSLEFTVTFKKIVVVQNALTRNVVAKSPNVGKKTKTGAQAPQAAAATQQSALFSAASSMSGSSNASISGAGNFLLSGGH